MEDTNAYFNVPEKHKKLAKTGGQDYLPFKVLLSNSNKTWQFFFYSGMPIIEMMK